MRLTFFRSLIPRLASALLVLAACTGTERDPGAPADLARLVFQSDRDGDFEIYTSRLDGSGPVRLTFHSAVDRSPDISPDGSSIIFTSDRTGNDEIFLLRLSGGEPVNLTNSPGADHWARWSPDGRRIVFHSDRDGDVELYTMNPDGSDVVRVTNRPGEDIFPQWTTDGTQLLFRRDSALWISAATGADARPLTDSPRRDQMASMSPDGRHIVFMSMRDGYCALYVIHADGSNPRNLTPRESIDASRPGCSHSPTWGRDGRIYFTSTRAATNGDDELFVMMPDGSAQTRLTTVPGRDRGARPF